MTSEGLHVIAQQKTIVSDVCHRCGGLKVPEPTVDPLTMGWRCVSCGERIDPVILAHREETWARTEAEKLFGRDGCETLN